MLIHQIYKQTLRFIQNYQIKFLGGLTFYYQDSVLLHPLDDFANRNSQSGDDKYFTIIIEDEEENTGCYIEGGHEILRFQKQTNFNFSQI